MTRDEGAVTDQRAAVPGDEHASGRRKVISVRLDEGELQQIHRAAQAVRGTKVSTFIRWAALDAAYRVAADGRRGPPGAEDDDVGASADPAAVAAVREARVELSRVGRNLNQLVRRANVIATQPESDDAVTTEQTSTTVRQVAAHVEALEVALGAVLPAGRAP